MPFNYNNSNLSIKDNDNDKLNKRRLISSNNIYENSNTTNIIIKDENIDINKNVPVPIKSTFKNYINKLHIIKNYLLFGPLILKLKDNIHSIF